MYVYIGMYVFKDEREEVKIERFVFIFEFHILTKLTFSVKQSPRTVVIINSLISIRRNSKETNI